MKRLMLIAMLSLMLRTFMTRFVSPPVIRSSARSICAASSLPDTSTVVVRSPLAVDSATCNALRIGRETVRKRTVISSWTALLSYVRVALADQPREQFRVLFLDKKNQLIADEVMNEGTVDHAPVYPREVMRRALELSASSLILVHNHPTH